MLAIVSQSGCVVIPYVVPPVRVQGQGGLALGGVYPTPGANVAQYRNVTGTSNIRVGAFPLGLFENLIDRPFDLGAGFLHERLLLSSHSGQRDRELNGAFIEGHYWLHSSVNRLSAFRYGVVVDVDYLREDSRHGIQEGVGVFTGLSCEWVSNGTGIFMGAQGGGGNSEGGIVGGFASGETGIGLVVGGAYRHIGAEPYWTVTAGLSLRLPAAAGLVVIFDD